MACIHSFIIRLRSTVRKASAAPLCHLSPARMRRFSFACDRGGTFTDVICSVEEADGSKRLVVCKLLSEDPVNYADAPTEGIRRLLEQETGVAHPRGSPLDTSRIKEIRMGTTVATNALLERRGERTAFVVTKGAPFA